MSFLSESEVPLDRIISALARPFRAVSRKSTPLGSGRGPRPPLTLHAGRDGLRLRAHHPEVAVDYHQPGSLSAEDLALPGEALDDFAARPQDAAVRLERVRADAVLARWESAGVPQAREYAAPDPKRVPPFPEEPRRLSPIDAGVLKALDDAAQTAARDGVRFALQKLQLRGGTGDIVATDGRRLLIQGNFAFPVEGRTASPRRGRLRLPRVAAERARRHQQDGQARLHPRRPLVFLLEHRRGRAFPQGGGRHPLREGQYHRAASSRRKMPSSC